jgi:hypothetical protein
VFDGSGTLAVRRHQGGRDDAVLRGDFVDDRPNLGDLAGAVDEDAVGRNVACEGAEAVAEGALVAGEPPLPTQGGDPRRARLSQAPRKDGVDGAAVGLRGLAGVDT